MAVVPSNNNPGAGILCGARDYNIQVKTSGTDWQTIKSVTGNTLEWVLYAQLPSSYQNVPLTGVRIQIVNVNNGCWYGDYNPQPTANGGMFYASPLRAMVYEVEAYGPSGQ